MVSNADISICSCSVLAPIYLPTPLHQLANTYSAISRSTSTLYLTSSPHLFLIFLYLIQRFSIHYQAQPAKMPPKIFKNMIIVLAGPWAESDENLRQWIELRGGVFSADLDRGVMHLVATPEQIFSKSSQKGV